MDKTQILEIKKGLKAELKSTQLKIDEYTKLCKPIAPENSIGRISRI